MKKILFVVLFLISSPAQAADFTGNEVLDICLKSDKAHQEFCTAYSIGTWEGVVYGVVLAISSNGIEYSPEKFDDMLGVCLPYEVTDKQIQNVFIHYLIDNPSTRYLKANALMIAALRSKFPCKK